MKSVMPCRVVSVGSLVAALGFLVARPASGQGTAEALLPRAVFAAAETAAIEPRPYMKSSTRPAPLVGLYVSFAALEVLDVASTQKALRAGGVEANPLVAPFAGSPLAMTVVKAGVAGAMIYASERLWKTNRKAAVLTMIGLNIAHGVVVAHNYRIAASQRR